MKAWVESEELGRLLDALGIRTFHTKNARTSTSDQHTTGLSRLKADKGGEKGDARRPFKRSGKTRSGQALLIRATRFSFSRFPFGFEQFDIEADHEGKYVELIFKEKSALSVLADGKLIDLMHSSSADELSVAWLDFDRQIYCWIRVDSEV